MTNLLRRSSAMGLVVALVFAISGPLAQDAKRSPLLIQLLVDPEKFHGREVRIYGYCRLEFEGLAIHLNKDDFVYSLGNRIWLVMESSQINAERKRITYCAVQGTFNSKNRGHLGMYAGAIENISHYEAWPPKMPAHPR